MSNLSGKNVRKGVQTAEDLHVIDEWRAAHRAVLNTFQAILRTRTRGGHKDYGTSDEVRLAFRNYFSDATDFIRLLEDGCAKLTEPSRVKKVFVPR